MFTKSRSVVARLSLIRPLTVLPVAVLLLGIGVLPNEPCRADDKSDGPPEAQSAGGKPGVISLEFPVSYADYALDPDTGDLAALAREEKQFLVFRAKDLESGRLEPAVKIPVGADPNSVCFKRFGESRLFVVGCKADPNIHLIDAKTLTLLKQINLGVPTQDVTTSENPDDPFVYCSSSEPGTPSIGVIDLRTGQSPGRVLEGVTECTLSANGEFAYTFARNAPRRSYHRTNSLSDPLPRFEVLNADRFSNSRYVPDPFGQYVAAVELLLTRTLHNQVAKFNFVPRCFFRKRPVIIGPVVPRTGAVAPPEPNVLEFHAASYNSLLPVGQTVKIPLPLAATKRSEGNTTKKSAWTNLEATYFFAAHCFAVRFFADDARDRVVCAKGPKVIFVPLAEFQLPPEPFLAADLAGIGSVQVGRENTIDAKTLDPAIEVAFDDVPAGAQIKGRQVTWRPEPNQLGNAKIVLTLKAGGFQRTMTFDFQVTYPYVDLPFPATQSAFRADGKQAALFAEGKSQTDSSNRLALVDFESNRILAERKIAERCRQLLFADDAVLLLTETESPRCEVLGTADLVRKKSLASDVPIQQMLIVNGSLVLQTPATAQVYDLKSFERIREFKLTDANNLYAPKQCVVTEEGFLINGVVYDSAWKAVFIAWPLNFPVREDAMMQARATFRAKASRPKAEPVIPKGRRMATASLPDSDVQVSLDLRTQIIPAKPPDVGMANAFELSLAASRNGEEDVSQLLIRSDGSADEVFKSKMPKLYVAPGRAYVLFGSQLYSWEIPPKSGGSASAAGPRFVQSQSTLALKGSGKTVLKHKVQGGEPPFEYSLLVNIDGIRIDEKKGDVTVEEGVIAPASLQQLQARIPPGSVDKQEINEVVTRASEILGRKANGIPVAIPIQVQVTDSNSATAMIEYFVFSLVPQTKLTKRVAQGDNERVNPQTPPKKSTTPKKKTPTPQKQAAASKKPAAAVKKPTASKKGASPKTEPTAEPAEGASPESEAIRTLKDAVATLESGNIEKFYELYAPIGRYQQLRDSGELKRFKTAQSQAECQKWLAALNPYRNAVPTSNAEGTVISFPAVSTEAEEESPKPPAKAARPVGHPKKGYGASLPSVIVSALGALDRGELEEFVDHLFPAGELERLREHDGKAKLLVRLKEQPELIDRMKLDLKACQKAAGQFNEDSSVATYSIPASDPSDKSAGNKDAQRLKKTVQFQKVGGAWRFYDTSSHVLRETDRQALLTPPNLSRDEPKLRIELVDGQWRIAELENF